MSSTSPSSLPRVTPSELRSTLLAAEKKVMVVDVRDESERTHAIKDAVHAPANELRAPGTEGASALDAVLQRAAEEGASEVVVHCALSQVRGPACAAALADRVAAASAPASASASASAAKGGAQQHPIKISVLHGGFDAWFEEVGARDSLTEEGPGK